MGFAASDLEELKVFLSKATHTCTYSEVQRETALPGSVAIRHDIDHDIDKALNFARWENENGFRSTYFVLHSAPYYKDRAHVAKCLNEFILLGHEIGLHNDALNAVDGEIVKAAELLIDERTWMHSVIEHHYSILGVADHGGAPHTNGDIWEHYTPESLGFEYEAYQLQKGTNTYISDNQGRWRAPLKMAQTFMLVHPTWWPV